MSMNRALIVLSIAAAAAAGAAVTANDGAGPARVEAIAGSTLHRLTLSPKAAQRLDIRTGTVEIDANGMLVAPYAALLYDVNADTWVYTNPESLVYVRQRVIVDSIHGETVTLKQGPPAGTPVVVVGAAELFGAEKGVGH
jgi:hypothetical protein